MASAMHSRTLRRWTVLVSVVFSALSLTGCAGRSVERFCAEARDGASAVAASDGNDPLADISNFGELEGLLDRLADAAPDEIRPDVEHARRTYGEALDAAKGAAGNPLGALFKGALSIALARESFRRVDDYARSNCDGQGIFGTAEQ